MTTQEILSNATEKMEKAIASLKKEYANVRTGRANPLILERVMVEYYGTPTPLRQMSNVTVQDGQTLVITPYDKTIVNEIEKAIAKADIGITPNSDGICVRLTFPPLTEDRRKEICKSVKKMAEDAKVAVRNIRRDAVDDVKKIEKDENLSEDEVRKITNIINDEYVVEGDLRREVSLNIKRLMEIGSYRGIRHRRGLPVRGQGTKTNARTRKGPKKTVGRKKKDK